MDPRGCDCSYCTGEGPNPGDPLPLDIGYLDEFIHITPTCEHDFQGWREHSDGRGGETVCTKCGMGAMAWSLRTGI